MQQKREKLRDAQQRRMLAGTSGDAPEATPVEPPAAAPVAGAASSSAGAAPPPQARQPPPVGGRGQWRVIETEGGWISWSEVESRVDAHCRGHAGHDKCSLNRQPKHGAVALAVLWLERGQASCSRYDHELLKDSLSSVDALSARSDARDRFTARRNDPEVRALLDAEVYMRDGRQDEPGQIPCPSVHKTLERLMKEPLNLT